MTLQDNWWGFQGDVYLRLENHMENENDMEATVGFAVKLGLRDLRFRG